MNIILFIISLIFIDIIYFLNKLIKKIKIKNLEQLKKDKKIDENEYSKYIKNINFPWIIIESVVILIVNIYVNFINLNVYTSNYFLYKLKELFLYYIIILLMFKTIIIVIRYIQTIIAFIIGFKDGLK